jgi:hypothetical protein
MAVLGTLILDNKEYRLITFDYKLTQAVDRTGRSSQRLSGALIDLTIESDSSTDLLEWALGNEAKDCTITFYKADGMSKFNEIKFQKAYCIEHTEKFEANGILPMRQIITIAEQRPEQTKKIIATPKQIIQQEEERIIYINGHFYNKDGTFEGKINAPDFDGSVDDVYVCDGKSTQKRNGEDFVTYNNAKLLKENNVNISHGEFANNSYLIYHEASLTGNKETALWIAHTVNNALHSKYKRGKNTFNELFKGTKYSTVPKTDKSKTISTKSNSEYHRFSRSAMISVLQGNEDPTGNSYFWDGLDFFTKSGELDHPKFEQYKSVNVLKEHLDLAIDFWSIDSNRAKINKNSTINSIFSKKEYTLKDVTDGVISNGNGVFSGARKTSQNNKAVHESLKSTGFKSGTMFWTTFKI